MTYSARVLMAKTCSAVDLLFWYAACDKGMCFFILPQHLSVINMVSIFFNGDSRTIGLTLNFSFFFGGFARGLSVPRRTSSGYSPASLVSKTPLAVSLQISEVVFWYLICYSALVCHWVLMNKVAWLLVSLAFRCRLYQMAVAFASFSRSGA